jgi:hypothetical protein
MSGTPGLIHRQHRARIPEVPRHVLVQGVPAGVLVPRREIQQPLHPVRRRVPANSASHHEFFRSICGSSPARRAARACAPPRYRTPPATCANISLNDSDHAACPSSARTRASSTTVSTHQAWPLRIPGSRSHAAQHHSPLLLYQVVSERGRRSSYVLEDRSPYLAITTDSISYNASIAPLISFASRCPR